jgi:Domain of unknown function (DUF4203)
MIGVITSVAVACIVFYAVYANSTTDPQEFFMWLGGGAVVGIILGCILMKKQKAGIGMLAGWGGIALGVIIDEMFVYRFGYTWSSYACMLGGASLAGWAASKWYEPMMVISTACLGAFLITQGIAFYVGNEFNVFTAANMVSAGLYDQIDQWYLIYIGAFFALTAIGYVIQMKQKK